MNTKHALTLVSFLFLSQGLQAEEQNKSFDGIQSLDYKNGSGNLKINAASGNQAKVSAKKIRADKDCEIEMEKSGSLLRVAAKSGLRGDCEIDFEIDLPKGVDISLKMGSGDALIRGAKGALTYKTGSGDLDFEGEATKVDGLSGSGDVSLRGLIGSSELKSGSGDISLTYEKAPVSTKLDIRSGSGDSSLILPAASQVKTDFTAGSGEVHNAFKETPNASFVVSMRSGSGDLNIKKVQ